MSTQERLGQTLINRLKYRHWALLELLAVDHNLHRAADALNVTQPTATKMLADVERAFGFLLFDRVARGLRPTELGTEVIHFARLMLTEIDRFTRDLESKRRGGFGQLTIGAIMGAAPDLVARAVTDLKARRPLMTIRVLGETSDQVSKLLELREIELAVGRFSGPLQHNHFDFEPLAIETLQIVVRASHPLATTLPRRLADIGDAAWILQPMSSPARQLMEEEFARTGMPTPRNLVESGSIFAMLQLLQGSDTVAVLPESVGRDHVRMGLVRVLPIRVASKLKGFGILTRKGETLSSAAQELIATLRLHASKSRRNPGAGP